MKNNWQKIGFIETGHHSQLPVTEVLEDRIRIYYSTRDKQGKSVPMTLDVSLENPDVKISEPKKISLEHGDPGLFDWSGIMPTKIINFENKKFLYYIGWSRRIDVPYHNNLGLAISEDNGESWRKFSEGPVFSTSIEEPGYIGTAEIIIENGIWRMWYLSCRKWIKHQDIMEPIYDIKYAESGNGINWKPYNQTHINLRDEEGGISSVTINKIDGLYEMLFSVRNKINYREISSDSYRIKRAYSKDGFNWEREESIELDISDDVREDFMVCYPHFTKTPKDTFLFYNGNGFGKTGIGIAKKFLV
jgi:hypothetical protein